LNCSNKKQSEHLLQTVERAVEIAIEQHEAVMELANLNIIEGKIPRKCRQLVREWAEIHQQELIDMWNSQDFHKIEPLE